LLKKSIYHKQLETLPIILFKKASKLRIINTKQFLGYFVLLDMLKILKMWRHIKGYPANGQTTYTNAHSSKKNKILFNFRLDQFYTFFGKKRRDIFPTLIQAEYNNRLWYEM
jgi:hypothetical protein